MRRCRSCSTRARDLDWFSSPVIIGLGIVALLSFIFFVIWELTEPNPIIDLRLFKGRNFLAGTVAISVAFAVFFVPLIWFTKPARGGSAAAAAAAH